MLLWHSLTIRNQPLNMQPNGIFSHCYGLLQSLSLRHASRQSRYGYSVTSLILVRLQNNCVPVFAHFPTLFKDNYTTTLIRY